MRHVVNNNIISKSKYELTIRPALVIWEYCTTLGEEVDMFWRRRVTATSLLFMANRWIMVASTALTATPATERT